MRYRKEDTRPFAKERSENLESDFQFHAAGNDVISKGSVWITRLQVKIVKWICASTAAEFNRESIHVLNTGNFPIPVW